MTEKAEQSEETRDVSERPEPAEKAAKEQVDMYDLRNVTRMVQAFCEERDWDRFHTPKDLAIGVITEASELLEHFRFVGDDEARTMLDDPLKREQVEDEVADVLFFLLRFCQRCDVQLDKALVRKLAKSARRYPVEKARGSNRKYTEL